VGLVMMAMPLDHRWRTYLLLQATLSVTVEQTGRTTLSHTVKPVKNEKIFTNHKDYKRVKESSRLLVSPECFAGRTKFFCVPHVCHLL